ncbi:uncharacterized protein LOC131047992 isoform X1 [Cryptomeria japonica]|uniref:uncharacterized protein LOC131047992 isoform X1 n=1 Tax=Cryptomeria japonica TaxID=3369 RepID=UPI0027DA5D4D|nr:uncharacterized protein LOC131047992 isoform X1 [Cryptomeria japonica]XP_059069186.1 uncharacterized protein LOC131047992 isoform X1 [Cryptomeria japonica]
MNQKSVSCALLLVLALCSSLQVSDAVSFWTCGTKRKYSVWVHSVTLNPDPIQKDKQATFTLSAISRRNVTIYGGKSDILITWVGLKVYSETVDLCSMTSCPIKQGNFTLTYTENWPRFGHFVDYHKLELQMLDEHSTELTCIDISFHINGGLPQAQATDI